jgi:protein-S-isoprenylcysteine O-methyltransferase Ste14
MIYIILGIIGFSALFFHDHAVVRGNMILRIIVLAIGSIILSFSLFALCFFFEKIIIPPVFRPIGIVFSFLFILFGIYSIIIEIPLKTRFKKNRNGEPLITNGTYALCRHPGVLWFSFTMLGLFLVFPSVIMLYSIPIWIASDILLVFLQERYYFNVIFGDKYGEYKKIVPFIIPNAKSIRVCIGTFFDIK